MWINATIVTDASHAEALSESLVSRGALSVSVEDADAGTDAETPQFGEPGSPAAPLWRRSRVVALFEPDADIGERVAAALVEIGVLEPPEVEYSEIAEQDWVRLTQSQFDPIRINDRLWIVPSWHIAPDPAAINLELDPGLAFGTGSHPTTRLCLEWLSDQVKGGEKLLDYGCGSGILALAAAKLGAAKVVGVDIDERALEAARDNAAKNQVQIRLASSREPITESFDIVVANILTNPLCLLAPALVRLVADGGRIALSGVLEAQAQQVIGAYAPYLSLHVGASLDGWVRLEGVRSC